MLMKTGTLKRNILDNQDGFAAIVIVLIMVLVLSLITVGFAQLMQSNQQSALSKQLSSQAYYAAESGINDAYQAYASGYYAPKTSCTGVTSSEPGSQYLTNASANSSNTSDVVNDNTNTDVTCLLMNPDPQTLQYGSINNYQPTVVEMQGCSESSDTAAAHCGSYGASNISTITISWQDNGDSNPLPTSCSSLSPQGNGSGQWNNQNILRISLVPLSGSTNPGSVSRAALVGSVYTAYLCPDGTNTSGTAQTVSVSPSNVGYQSGQILDSKCSSSGCAVTLDVSNLTDSSGSPYSTYLLVMRSIYSNNITATISMNYQSQQLYIGDAQLLVDSTGKAQNVQKRIQVRIPETGQYYFPNSAAQGELCKQLELVPSGLSTNSSDNAPSGSLCSTYDSVRTGL
jgi:Tfp pilus assembly protein PilX